MSKRDAITTTINEPGQWLGVETEVLGTGVFTHCKSNTWTDENGNPDDSFETRYFIHDQLKDRPYEYFTNKKAITDIKTKQVVAQDFKSVKEARRFILTQISEPPRRTSRF